MTWHVTRVRLGPGMSWITSWEVSEVVLAAGTLLGQLVGCPFGGTHLDADDTSVDILATRLAAAGSIHPAWVFCVVLTRRDTSNAFSEAVLGGIGGGTCFERDDASSVVLGDWPAGAGAIHSE